MAPGCRSNSVRARPSQVEMAVPPLSRRGPTAAAASRRVRSSARTSVGKASDGYTHRASCEPAMTANRVPSGSISTAVLAARRAARILASGMPIEPDVSTIRTTALSWAATIGSPPVDATVTTAFTSDASAGRNSFW